MKFGLDDSVTETIQAVLETHPNVDKAYIFGSRAKGNYRADSDIDIALKGHDITLDDIIKLGVAFEDRGITHKIDLVDYNNINEPALAEHIDRVGIEFYSRWKEYRLGEVAEIKYGKDHKELLDGPIPVYGSGGLMRYANKALYEEESVLIPRKGSLNNIFYKKEPFWTVDTMFWTILDKQKVVPKFLFYQLHLVDFSNMNVGSAVPSLTVPVLNAIDVLLPPLPEQTAIASILSSLDDKIDLLHRQNKTLEALAETLFRQWFVEEAEESWEEGTVDDEFVFIMGQSPTGKDLNEVGNGMVFFQGRSDFGFRFPEPRVFTTSPIRLARQFDTLISVRAPVGDINMAIEACCLGRGVAAFRYKHNDKFYSYCYYKLRSLMLQIKQFEDNGSVFGSIGKDDFAKLKNIIPPLTLIYKFQQKTELIDEKIFSNTNQIRTLSQLRDTLLPKLVSGEVRVRL